MNAAEIVDRYRVSEGKGFRLADHDPGDTAGLDLDKKETRSLLQQGVQRLSELQEKLYAQDRWAVLLIFQAMDAAGKAMLALFPAISVAISLYGLVADPVAVEGQLEALRGVLPASTYELIARRVHDLAAAGPTKLSWGLALSLVVALWSAMNGIKAIISALNVAYEERERRSFLGLNLVALLFTLGGILGVVLALTVIVIVPAALAFIWLGPLASIAVRVCSFGLLLGFVVLGLAGHRVRKLNGAG